MMNKYQNTKTGVIIEVESKIGGDWVLVESKQSLSTAEKKEEKPVKKEKKKK